MSGPLPNVPISNEGLRELEIWLAGRQTEKVEHWIHVGTWGTDADTNQHSPPFQNSWTNATGKQRMRFGRRKRERGVKVNQLVIEGEVTGGADGTTVFTLPASYRPLETAHALGSSDDSVSLWRIETTGAVVFLGALSCTPAGGGFIQFDVDNEGGYLDITANDPGPIDPVVGVPLGLALKDASGVGLMLRAGTGLVFIDDINRVFVSGDFFSVTDTSWNSLLDLNGNTANVYLHSSGNITVWDGSSNVLLSIANDSSTVHNLAAGKTLVVNDGSGNPVFTLTG